MSAALLPLVLLAPVLVAVVLGDLARLTISNRLVVIALAMGAVLVPLLAWDEAALRAGAALAVFAPLLVFFALGLMGGGDVKMLPVLVFFVPPEHWALAANLFSAALLLGVAGTVLARAAVAGRPPTGWLALDTPRAFPMGVAIGGAGLALPLAATLL